MIFFPHIHLSESWRALFHLSVCPYVHIRMLGKQSEMGVSLEVVVSGKEVRAEGNQLLLAELVSIGSYPSHCVPSFVLFMPVVAIFQSTHYFFRLKKPLLSPCTLLLKLFTVVPRKAKTIVGLCDVGFGMVGCRIGLTHFVFSPTCFHFLDEGEGEAEGDSFHAGHFDVLCAHTQLIYGANPYNMAAAQLKNHKSGGVGSLRVLEVTTDRVDG